MHAVDAYDIIDRLTAQAVAQITTHFPNFNPHDHGMPEVTITGNRLRVRFYRWVGNGRSREVQTEFVLSAHRRATLMQSSAVPTLGEVTAHADADPHDRPALDG